MAASRCPDGLGEAANGSSFRNAKVLWSSSGFPGLREHSVRGAINGPLSTKGRQEVVGAQWAGAMAGGSDDGRRGDVPGGVTGSRGTACAAQHRRARDARMCKQQLLQLGLLTHSVLAQSGLAHSVRQRRACWLNAQRRVATSVISRAPSRGARGRRALCMGRLPTLPRNGLAQTGLAQGRLVQRRTRARFARTAAEWIVATSHTAR